MRCSVVGISLASVALLALGACGGGKKATTPANARFVVEQFENLGPTRATDWTAAALGQAVAWRFASDPRLVAVAAEDSEQVRQSGAGLVLRGQIRTLANGSLRVLGYVVDSASGSILAQVDQAHPAPEFFARSAQALIEAVARVSGQPAPPGANPEQFSGWQDFVSAAATGPEAIEKFLTERPNFAPAYLTLGRIYSSRGDSQAIEALLAKRSSYREGSADLVKPQLRYLLAATPAARLEALEESLEIRRGDLRMREEAAALAQAAGRWDRAVLHYREILQANPDRALLWNAVGYAEAQQGKTEEALQALAEYRRLAPNEPNPLDSKGEVLFMGRRFAEAAQTFDELSRAHPGFQNGVGVWKAAFAYWRAGNLALADQRHQAWLEAALVSRRPVAANASTPSILAFQRAYWLARTRRLEELEAFWTQQLAQSAGERKAAAEMHRAAIRFGLSLEAPPRSKFLEWAKALTSQDLRNEFASFGLLAEKPASPDALRARLTAAVPPPQMPTLGAALFGAGQQIWAPLPEGKPAVEALPENPPSILDALLLRRRNAVLP